MMKNKKEPKWWEVEVEAEERGLTVDEYLKILKLEKENEANRKIRIGQLEKIVRAEKEKTKAYDQIAKIHSAYIAILLKKLVATKDNAVVITSEEVSEAMEKYETRGLPMEGGFGLYFEEVG